MLTIGSLFSGIGGLELGLEMAGLGPVLWQCEQNDFCRQVLAKHWPNVARFDDVRTLTTIPAVDIICGGFPCQDISSAGKGAGLAGSRSGLWFEFARIIESQRPQWVVIENVASGATRWVDAVVAWLESQNYHALPVPLSAADVGAPHLRRRVFVVAYSERDAIRDGEQRKPKRWSRGIRDKREAKPMDDGEKWDAAYPDAQRRNGRPRERESKTGWGKLTHGGWRAPVSPVCRVDDGIPRRMDRLRALGNAVVPQCAEVIGWMIREIETTRRTAQKEEP